jgi:uncharacterized protein DUF2442
MKFAPRGKITSDVEVTNIGPVGFWLLLDGRELFVEYERFPWFQDASVRQITGVERPSAEHLYWPSLDVDLAVESLDHPERFPLMSRVRPSQPLQRSGSPRSATSTSKQRARRPR